MANNESLYVANDNGDWWELRPEGKLFVLRLEDLPKDVRLDPHLMDDGFEDLICEYGTVIEELYDDLQKVLAT